MLGPTAHIDSFARDHLPPPDLWPHFNATALRELGYLRPMNAAAELLDRAVARGHGARACLRTSGQTWSYEQLLSSANRIARVLVDAGLVPGNRVLLRSANNPMLAACFLAILKAGGIAVPTMPLLRARELTHVLEKAEVQFAICDSRLSGELEKARTARERLAIAYFNTDAPDGLERRAARHNDDFTNVVCSHDDVAIIAFTSGTTGSAKATAHFHRDLLVVCDCFPRSILSPSPDDVFTGSAPFAFTFGLGAVLLFPLRFGASAVLLEQCTPETMLEAIAAHGVTRLFTVPTLYRGMAPLAHRYDLSRLTTCISSGEHLPAAVFESWERATGQRLINSIGSTEMLHAFIVMPPDAIKPGAVGKPLPGYEAMVVDDEMRPVPPDTVGRLAVRGPTGCRYLSDPENQGIYVRDGWNLSGDAFSIDPEGYFHYHARSDDMIVSAGYNISGVEVEEALLMHPQVRECAVVGVPDEARGQIVKAFVVLTDSAERGEAFTETLQDMVKSIIAPHKYPRVIEYLDALPRTVSGKVRRGALRQRI
ncbi:MAG: AMP-binding protein [Xanthobacteraceae bacterium]